MPLGKYTFVFQAEFMVVTHEANTAAQGNINNKYVRIMTDSRAVEP